MLSSSKLTHRNDSLMSRCLPPATLSWSNFSLFWIPTSFFSNRSPTELAGLKVSSCDHKLWIVICDHRDRLTRRKSRQQRKPQSQMILWCQPLNHRAKPPIESEESEARLASAPCDSRNEFEIPMDSAVWKGDLFSSKNIWTWDILEGSHTLEGHWPIR